MNNNHGRRRARRASKKAQISRILLTICMMALVAMVSVGATLAWLTDDTPSVTNTFAPTGINITLTETDYDPVKDALVGDAKEGHTENDYRLVPGKTYPKNPTVTVVGSNENVEVYLFVEFDAGTSAQYMTYSHIWDQEGTAWEKLGEQNVWYTTVPASTENQSFALLTNDQVTVNSGLTKENMPTTAPTMVYTAYAIQTEGTGTAAEAWAKISN